MNILLTNTKQNNFKYFYEGFFPDDKKTVQLKFRTQMGDFITVILQYSTFSVKSKFEALILSEK